MCYIPESGVKYQNQVLNTRIRCYIPESGVKYQNQVLDTRIMCYMPESGTMYGICDYDIRVRYLVSGMYIVHISIYAINIISQSVFEPTVRFLI